jgi:hypothetical protein
VAERLRREDVRRVHVVDDRAVPAGGYRLLAPSFGFSPRPHRATIPPRSPAPSWLHHLVPWACTMASRQ